MSEKIEGANIATMLAAALADGENGVFKLQVDEHNTEAIATFGGGLEVRVFSRTNKPPFARATVRVNGTEPIQATVIAVDGGTTFLNVAMAVKGALRNLSAALLNRLGPLTAAKQLVDGVSVSENPSAEARIAGFHAAVEAGTILLT